MSRPEDIRDKLLRMNIELDALRKEVEDLSEVPFESRVWIRAKLNEAFFALESVLEEQAWRD